MVRKNNASRKVPKRFVAAAKGGAAALVEKTKKTLKNIRHRRRNTINDATTMESPLIRAAAANKTAASTAPTLGKTGRHLVRQGAAAAAALSVPGENVQPGRKYTAILLENTDIDTISLKNDIVNGIVNGTVNGTTEKKGNDVLKKNIENGIYIDGEVENGSDKKYLGIILDLAHLKEITGIEEVGIFRICMNVIN